LVAVLAAACSSGDGNGGAGDSNLPDPCTLVSEETLDTYFDEDLEPEPSGSGRFLSCTWSDSNANSVLISVAESSEVNRPDPCPGCIDLDFGDDGFATAVPLQATAEFVSGGRWYSVTTTGFGDDGASIAALAESIHTEISG
jgi:hypothetical protein